MKPANLEELRFHFCKAMAKYCNGREKGNLLNKMWEPIVEAHKGRPFHNLDLAYQDLDFARTMGANIPDFVIIIAVLRNYRFSPLSKNNSAEAAHHLSYFLEEPFGWNHEDINEIVELTKKSSLLSTPTNTDSFDYRLLHDLKMSRLAKDYNEFLKDRKAVREEYFHISDKTYFRHEKTMLIYFNTLRDMFSLPSFQKLTAAARDNVRHRIETLNNISV